MQLVPVRCRGCSSIYLESALVVVADNVPCDCGGIARALTSAAYTTDDESLFDAVVSSLLTAEVSSATAPRLLVALEGRDSFAPGVALGRLRELVPELAVIELIVMGDAATARKAERMFETVLEALAATRSRSDLAPRPDVEPASHRAGRAAK